MAQKNLDKMSLKELQSLRADVDAAIAGFEKRKRAEALKEMEAVAKKHGLSVSDVLGGASKKGGKAKGKAPAKFRNPADSNQTWSGRGRQPQWYKDAIAAGKTDKDLSV